MLIEFSAICSDVNPLLAIPTILTDPAPEQVTCKLDFTNLANYRFGSSIAFQDHAEAAKPTLPAAMTTTPAAAASTPDSHLPEKTASSSDINGSGPVTSGVGADETQDSHVVSAPSLESTKFEPSTMSFVLILKLALGQLMQDASQQKLASTTAQIRTNRSLNQRKGQTQRIHLSKIRVALRPQRIAKRHAKLRHRHERLFKLLATGLRRKPSQPTTRLRTRPRQSMKARVGQCPPIQRAWIRISQMLQHSQY